MTDLMDSRYPSNGWEKSPRIYREEAMTHLMTFASAFVWSAQRSFPPRMTV